MTERWIGAKVSVTRWVSDDPQPGIVECELQDVRNRRWKFIDKCSMFENIDIGPDTIYPQPGFILCVVEGRSMDAAERDVISIESRGPCSLDGESRFRVFPSDLIEGTYGSTTQKPWNGCVEPNANAGERA